LHDFFRFIKTCFQTRFETHLRPVFFILSGFIAGCLFTGFFIFGSGSGVIGKLDSRYHSQHARAAETITRLAW
jgi:hypothetical protein